METTNTRPIDSVYTTSCLIKLIGHPDYLNYCLESKAIQEYWTQPEYVVYPVNQATGEKVPIVTSHINPGDFFNLGPRGKAQIGIVSKKITIVQSGLKPEDQKLSVQKPGGDYLEYQLAGDIGGFFFMQPHEEMAAGFFQWLPLPFQLMAIGMVKEGSELQDISFSVTRKFYESAN